MVGRFQGNVGQNRSTQGVVSQLHSSLGAQPLGLTLSLADTIKLILSENYIHHDECFEIIHTKLVRQKPYRPELRGKRCTQQRSQRTCAQVTGSSGFENFDTASMLLFI